jgi:hypothetical protein
MYNEKPVFIAGIGHSGTTLLHRILCEHENVAWLSRLAKPHPRIPVIYRVFLEAIDYPVLGQYLKNKFKPTECYEFWECYCHGFGSTFRDLGSQDVTNQTKTHLRNAITELLTSQRKRFIAKITGWPRLGYLYDLFNDARFIHICRDGRAVVNSRLQGSWWRGWQGPHNWNRPLLTPDEYDEWNRHDQSFVALACIEWKILMDAYETARSVTKDAQCLQIRYEDLCADPLSVLRRVIEFCELSWNAEFEKALGNYRVKSTNYKWKENLNVRQHHIMECVLRNHLDRYGYS